ncbi:sal-like protein 1 [Triplophysa dalaica]|uniref:sal-like protein 1 n=1 Tax=Triplophysa dalaica TaxID=1582913 RepID=UPI0024DF56BD|nr:sal-like protein 1 [Triplophysa dalaica]
MSRRKQAKPQYVLTDNTMDNFSTPMCDIHICEQCCAEFANITDLHQHQQNCLKDQLILLVTANDSPDFQPSTLTSSSPFRSDEPLDGVKKTSNTKELGELLKDETSREMDISLNTFDEITYETAKNSHPHHDNGMDTVLPQENRLLELCKLSVINSNVFIENLENTKVAVAQFSLESIPNTRNDSTSKTTTSGLIEQLLDLQQQQIQQLKLIEEIQWQILLLADQNTDTPVASSLIKLSSNVSEQLAATAELAENLASQSANAKNSKHISQTIQNDSWSDKENTQVTDENRGNSVPLKVSSDLCSNQSLHNNTGNDKVSQTNFKEQSTAHPLITDCILNQHELIHKQNNALPSISAIVEDLNALTALVQQRKGKPLNMTLFNHERPGEDCTLKHKCRFCAKVFGSDSALQIHLRSHTGERPYKCNICGNRFSTRGNLKVHFQRHKEKYPNIQLNPYPVPEHLDNIPTSTGIPYGMSFAHEKPVPMLLENKPLAGNSLGYILPSSLPSLPPIKKEEEGVSITKPHSSVSVSEVFERHTGHQDGSSNIPSLISKEKFPEVNPELSLCNFVRFSRESSGNHIVTNTMDSRLTTELKLEQLEPKFLFRRHPNLTGSSETLKLERLVENIDKKSSDPNECVICHRVLSCQSALKMHYRTHTGERPFKCRVCGRAFTTKGNLKTHYGIHRSMQPLRIQHSCPICQEKFTNAVVLQQHIHMHMGGHIPNFPLDDNHPDSMDQDTDLPDEKNSRVDNSTDYMEVVKGVSDCKNQDALPDNLRSSPASSEFARATAPESQISNVDTKFTTQNGLVHGDCLTQKSSSVNLDCKRNNSANTERAHIWKPPSSNSSTSELHEYSISEGNLTTSSAESHSLSLSYHNLRLLDGTSRDISKDSMSMILSTSERENLKSNVCDICNKTFACQSALEIHYRSHTKERPFICSACNRGFSTKGNLKQHMLTHQMQDLPSQLFEPENQIFATNQFRTLTEPIMCSNRVDHNSYIKKYSKDSTACVVSSSISTLPTLSTATLTAEPLPRSAKEHFCHTCGKTFSSSSALQIHERTHTGEKPFACNICGRAFTTKGNLKVHMGTHMWSSSPARRGHRLSVDGPFLRSIPERFQDTPLKDFVGRGNSEVSIGLWSHFASLNSGLALRANKIPVIQNGAINHLSAGHVENLEKFELNRAFTLASP